MTDTYRHMSLEQLREHGESVGYDDVLWGLVEAPMMESILEDDESERVSDDIAVAYDGLFPHIRTAWAAMGAGDPDDTGLERESLMDGLFRAIHLLAYEAGYLATKAALRGGSF